MRRRSTAAALAAAALLLPACVSSAPVVAVEVVGPDADVCTSPELCDGRVLLVEVGACQAGGLQIETDENDERVRIAVRARGAGDDPDCTTPFTLTLDEPLGDRIVIDAVTERPIEVVRR